MNVFFCQNLEYSSQWLEKKTAIKFNKLDSMGRIYYEKKYLQSRNICVFLIDLLV